MIKLNYELIEQNHFPDGSLLMKTDNFYCGMHNENIIEWKYENDGELFALYSLARHIKTHSPERAMVLFMNYIPHARQDRVKKREDVFTLKYFSEIINSMGFDKVYVLDPHSSVSEALIDNLVINNGKDKIRQVIDELIISPIVYYPDNGAYKKYSDFINMPSCYGVKNRDWSTGKILGLDVITNGIDIKDKTILMIDDIISYGGSMYYSAKKLKELGCGDIYIYASHVENSILEGDLIKSGLFKRIYTTNSLFSGEHELIEIL